MDTTESLKEASVVAFQAPEDWSERGGPRGSAARAASAGREARGGKLSTAVATPFSFSTPATVPPLAEPRVGQPGADPGRRAGSGPSSGGALTAGARLAGPGVRRTTSAGVAGGAASSSPPPSPPTCPHEPSPFMSHSTTAAPSLASAAASTMEYPRELPTWAPTKAKGMGSGREELGAAARAAATARRAATPNSAKLRTSTPPTLVTSTGNIGACMSVERASMAATGASAGSTHAATRAPGVAPSWKRRAAAMPTS